MSKHDGLFQNSVYNVIYKLLDALFPLVSAAYLGRVLMSDGVGKVAYAQNIAQYFVLAASLGIPNYGIREIARRRKDEEQTKELFSSLFFINLISTLICTALYYALILNLPYFSSRKMISLAAGLLIIFNAFNVDWFYQGQEAFKYIAIRSFVVKVISLAAIFVFIRSSEDYVRYMLVIVLTTGANYIINMLQLRKFGIRLTCHGIKILPHMKPIFIMLGTTVAIELYTMLDTAMLGLLCDEKNVGYYTNAMKVVKIIITVITAIGGTLLPHLSQYHMEGDDESCGRIVSRVFEIMLFLFLPCCVGLMLTADDLMVVMFGESFAPAGETLRIAALLTLALGFSNLFGTQVLLTFGEEKKLLFCTIVGAVSNVCLNFSMIPRFAQNGAAAASVISEALVTVCCVCFSVKHIQVRLRRGYLAKTVIAVAFMGALTWIVMSMANGEFLRLAATVVTGVVSYFALCIMLRNPVCMEYKQTLLRREKQ